MPTIEDSEVIERSPEEVWEYLADPRNELQWQSRATEREVLTEEPIGDGSRFRVVDRFLGKRLDGIFEVTSWEPSKQLRLETVSGPFEMKIETTLEPVEGGTCVAQHYEAEAGLGGFFGSLLDSVAVNLGQREVAADLAKLKALLEVTGEGST